MARPNKRKRLTAVVRAVADVLRRDWDPIGRGSMPELPADEYESYAPQIISLVIHGADDNAVAKNLAELERSVMGVGGASDLRIVAASIRRTVLASTVSAS